MFIDRLDGNWLQHPFWKSSFKLDSPKQLKTLQESAVTHVWIDTDRGLDVAVNSTASEAPVNLACRKNAHDLDSAQPAH